MGFFFKLHASLKIGKFLNGIRLCSAPVRQFFFNFSDETGSLIHIYEPFFPFSSIYMY